MEKRNIFKKIFGTNKLDYSQTQQLKLINDYEAHFFNFEGELYDIDTVRSCIHAIASNAAKRGIVLISTSAFYHHAGS